MISRLIYYSRKNVRTRRVLMILLCLFACWSQLFTTGNAIADETDFPTLEPRYSMGCTWLISLNTTVLDHMLDYPGSLIHPITQIRVMYYLRDQRTHGWTKGEKYEDFWFSSGRPIGCRIYRNLPIPSGSYGVMYVARTKDCGNQTRAIDDSILRLYLDLMSLNCVLSSVVLPQEICDNAASDLGAFNFYRASIINGGRYLLLHFLSSPMGFDKYYMYTYKDVNDRR